MKVTVNSINEALALIPTLPTGITIIEADGDSIKALREACAEYRDRIGSNAAILLSPNIIGVLGTEQALDGDYKIKINEHTRQVFQIREKKSWDWLKEEVSKLKPLESFEFKCAPNEVASVRQALSGKHVTIIRTDTGCVITAYGSDKPKTAFEFIRHAMATCDIAKGIAIPSYFTEWQAVQAAIRFSNEMGVQIHIVKSLTLKMKDGD